MATALWLKAKPLLLVKGRQSFHVNFFPVKSVKCSRSSNFDGLKAKSFMNLTSSSTRKRSTGFPNFNCEASSKEKPFENYMFKTLKWLKILGIVTMQSLFLMMMLARGSALARSGGVMGGTSSSSSSSSSSSTYYHSDSELPDLDKLCVIIFLLLLAGFVVLSIKFLRTSESVVKLQVGLLVSKPTLQRDLLRIARITNTSNASGLISMLEGTIKTILEHPEYWISCHSSVDETNISETEKYFEKILTEERAKYDEETVVNLNNMKKEKSTSGEGFDEFKETYMVVTILVAVNEKIELPEIKDAEGLKKALKKLRHLLTSSEIKAVNVLWTPQKYNDFMSLEEVNKIYPHLKPL